MDDVDLYQDLPQGHGRVDMEEWEKDLYSLNYMEYKEAKDELKREKIAQEAFKVIADALKAISDKQSSEVD